MRSDMKKLVFGRSRTGGWQSDKGYNNKNSRNIEELPSKEKMKVRYRDRKISDNYFAPLEGFFHKNVGRPWNKIYSEIKKAFKTDLSLIWNFVEVSPMLIENKDWEKPGYCGSNGHPLPLYYVDPTTGLLQKSKKEWSDYWIKQIHSRDLDHSLIYNNDWKIEFDRMYREIKGVWYEIILTIVPKESLSEVNYQKEIVYDVVLKFWVNFFNLWALKQTHGQITRKNKLIAPSEGRENGQVPNHIPIYAKAKRQITVKEIRTLGLK